MSLKKQWRIQLTQRNGDKKLRECYPHLKFIIEVTIETGGCIMSKCIIIMITLKLCYLTLRYIYHMYMYTHTLYPLCIL